MGLAGFFWSRDFASSADFHWRGWETFPVGGGGCEQLLGGRGFP